LSARLLVEATLPELGVEAGTLHLALKLAEGALEVLAFVDNHFQGIMLLTGGWEPIAPWKQGKMANIWEADRTFKLRDGASATSR